MVSTDGVLAKIKEIANEGKLSCTEARQIASDLGVEEKLIGRLCNENDIKIYACELGCF